MHVVNYEDFKIHEGVSNQKIFHINAHIDSYGIFCHLCIPHITLLDYLLY